MKVKVKIIPELDETEIIIQSKEMTSEIKNIERFISLYDLSLSVKKGDRNYTISPHEIYYIDAVDHDVFVYTKDDVYEINQKLYQLEEMYPSILLRVNKNTLINYKMIHSFKSSINGRMEAELKNKDRIVISRMYVPKLKALLKGENI
ncbi:MAG: LytTR family transcriptional regulator [Bacillota bacterium]|nr:MAG: LytTR family transcriptional regulator [Bacillota bacterium]